MSNEKRQNSKSIGGGPIGGAPMIGPKAKDFKGTIKKLFSYLKPYKLLMIIVLLFAIGSSAFSIVGPKVLGSATTEIFNGLVNKVTGNGNGIDFKQIESTLMLLILLYIISALFTFIQTFITSDIAQKISYNLRKEISHKINNMPLSYFDKTTHGEVLSKVTNDVDAISQNLNQVLSQTITSVTTLIGVLIMMFSISIPMTFASLLIIPLSAIIIPMILKKSQVHFKNQQKYLGNTNGHVEEIFSGHNIMRVFNGEKKAISEFEELNNKLYDSAWRSQFLSGMLQPIMMFIGNIGYVIVAIMGGYLAIKRSIEVGDILSFTQYSRSFMQPITQTAQIANIMQATAAAAERVFEFLEEKEEIEDTKKPVDTQNIIGEVAFKNVNFGYNENQTIINNFSINVKPGQKVAIVGPTGAGKTTVVKLLMRFYDINSGNIFIDGHDIKDFSRDKLRKIFGMVLQDTWLFSGSLMENIRYGKLDASDEDVIEAAKLAHAHNFIKTQSGGYSMEINEEANNISQGQKQLLTIARAILADPKILILDEATSSVDTRTEVLIQNAMNNLLKGRTSFIIAHRLSTIREADVILVMKDGDIIEQGNHEDLLIQNGFYADLYNSQFDDGEQVS